MESEGHLNACISLHLEPNITARPVSLGVFSTDGSAVGKLFIHCFDLPLFHLCMYTVESDDYLAVNETLVYSVDSPAMMCVMLEVFEDSLVEGNETLSLVLTTEDPAVLLEEPTTALVTIGNTDSKNHKIWRFWQLNFATSSC